ncbi:MAG: hypothetical protein ACOX2W_12945 [Desulfomonilia bacterium]
MLELYGLVSFIDEHTFGDLKSYRHQFARLTTEDTFDDLKQRLKPICKRTLRRQVLEYIRYTERKAYTQEFVPSKDEEALYHMVIGLPLPTQSPGASGEPANIDDSCIAQDALIFDIRHCRSAGSAGPQT